MQPVPPKTSAVCSALLLWVAQGGHCPPALVSVISQAPAPITAPSPRWGSSLSHTCIQASQH